MRRDGFNIRSLKFKFKINLFTIDMIFLFTLFYFSLCQNCTKNKIGELDGKFIIVGLFPMNCSRPSEIDNRTIAWMEAMKYTIEEKNKLLKENFSFLNENVFGYAIYDTYDPTNMDGTSLALLDSLTFYNKSFGSICGICKDLNPVRNILGFVGPAESSTSIYVHELTSTFESIPIISYAAVSLELNDKNKYANFFRTAPADDTQANFIKKVLIKYNWRIISVIAVDSSYGRAGLDVLKQNYEKDDICLDVSEILPQAYDSEKYKNITDKLSKSKAKVVVFWGQFRPLDNLLQEARNQNLSNLTWIISKAVSTNYSLLNSSKTINNKLLFVSYTAGEDEAFKSYFYSLTYKNSSEWLKVIFERNGYINNPHVNVKEIKKVFDLSGVSVVQFAVNAFIEAFFQYQTHFSNSSTVSNSSKFHEINDRIKFREIIKNISVSIPTLNSSKPSQFDSNQNFEPIYFELYTHNESEFIIADRWSYNASDLENITVIQDNLFNIKSFCDCGTQGKRKVNKVSKCSCECTPCPENRCDERQFIYWSFTDSRKSLYPGLVLSTSILGITTSTFYTYTFIKKKSTPIVRSSYYELSLVQMTMHLTWFVLPLLTFGEEIYLKCFIRIYFSGFLHVCIVTILLVKITRVIAIFSFGTDCRLLRAQMVYLRTKIVILLILFPCIFLALIFVIDNSRFRIEMFDKPDEESFTMHRYCDSISYLVIHLCFVLILSIFCGIQSFKGRHLPATYNENKNIAYSLFLSNVILCVTVAFISGDFDKETKKLLFCLLTNILNFLLMNFLFWDKTKRIWLKPKKNTREVFTRISFKKELERSRSSQSIASQSITSFPENMNEKL